MKKPTNDQKLYRFFQRIALALEDSAHHCWCAELAERGMKKAETANFCKKQARRYRRLAKQVTEKLKGMEP